MGAGRGGLGSQFKVANCILRATGCLSRGVRWSDVCGKLGACEVASRSHPWHFMKEGGRPGPEGPGIWD